MDILFTKEGVPAPRVFMQINFCPIEVKTLQVWDLHQCKF